ncbi:MAG: hypothetical protein HY567_02270 [Candidatus Kerfeldbacteria bacterium]|nr:hypothetical protein [Candidatus Kerfeldbacteria bacterium]
MTARLRLTSIGVFVLGVAVAVLLVRLPVGHSLVNRLDNWGYLTALVGGLLYTTSFTSATGTVVLAHVGESLNPVLAAVIGGLGSLLYDLTIFTVFARQFERRPALHRLVDFFQRHRRLRWTAGLSGALIIASPLPDELGIALLDGAGTKERYFIPLSFGFNVLGILAIVGLF